MRREEFFDIIGEVEEQKVVAAGMFMTAGRRTHPVWLKFGALAACLCLVAVGLFILGGPFGEADLQPGGVPGTNVTGPGDDNETTQPGQTDQLVVNEVDQVASADMDAQITSYNKLPYHVWMAIMDDFYEFTGISYESFQEKIPDIFVNGHFYSLSTRGYKDADLKDEYRLHDYVFEYQTENGGVATIALCSFDEPLRDHFIVCDNPEQSRINGVEVVVYGYGDHFMVQFSYGNVNYDIETRDITLEELEELLTGILC